MPMSAPNNQQLIPTTKSKRKKKNQKNKDKMFKLVVGASTLNETINAVESTSTNDIHSPKPL